LTWEQIVSIEPRLGKLAERASKERFAANKDELWSNKYKPELTNLVGYYSDNGKLQTSEAYVVAVRKICELLRY